MTRTGGGPVAGAPWSARAPEGATSAHGVAARLGAYCWVDQQLFAVLGSWVADIGEPDAKAMVAEHGEHAAWRAQRWFELLPTAPPGAQALVTAPPGLAEVMSELPGTVGGPDRTAAKLLVAYRVLLPRLATALRAHLDWSPAISEGAVRRLLEISLADVLADAVAGARLLEVLTDAPNALGEGHSAAARVDLQIASAGGILGPGSVGVRVSGGAP